MLNVKMLIPDPAKYAQIRPNSKRNLLIFAEFLQNLRRRNANVKGPGRFVNGLLILRGHGAGENPRRTSGWLSARSPPRPPLPRHNASLNGLVSLANLVCRAKFLSPGIQMLNVKMLILAAPNCAKISPDEAKLAEKSADFRRI